MKRPNIIRRFPKSMATSTAALIFSALFLPAVAAAPQKMPMGISSIVVQSSDQASKTIVVNHGGEQKTIEFVANSRFYNNSSGGHTNINTFLNNCNGRQFYINILDNQGPNKCNTVFSGPAFAHYKVNALVQQGELSQRVDDYFRVGEYVYKIAPDSDLMRNGQKVTSNQLKQGDYVFVEGKRNVGVPTLLKVRAFTKKPIKLPVDIETAKVNKRAVDDLKDGRTAKPLKAPTKKPMKGKTNPKGDKGGKPAKVGGGQ